MTHALAGVLHVTADEVTAGLPLPVAYASQRAVFEAFARGEATLAPRALMNYAGNTAFCYLARASVDGPPVVKVGSVNPGNARLGLANVQATLIVLDAVTGALSASIDGESVTLLRTAAASVVAIDALAPSGPGPRAVVIVGTGRQGLAHAQAVQDRHPDAAVTIVGRDPLSAVAEADVVVLCTTSPTPVIDAGWLRPGSTVVSIGSFAPDRCEFGIDLVSRAGRVFVDDAATALRQSGPVVEAVAAGVIDEAAVLSLGDVLVGTVPGRKDPDEVLVYTSVGLGIQDAAVAEILLGLSST